MKIAADIQAFAARIGHDAHHRLAFQQGHHATPLALGLQQVQRPAHGLHRVHGLALPTAVGPLHRAAQAVWVWEPETRAGSGQANDRACIGVAGVMAPVATMRASTMRWRWVARSRLVTGLA